MRVAVIGAGLMGHALALVFALGGHEVRLTDNKPMALKNARGLMEKALATLREAGEVDAAWTDDRLHAAVSRYASLADTVREAELIVEAIDENPEMKRELYAELDHLAPMDAIIASNTSLVCWTRSATRYSASASKTTTRPRPLADFGASAISRRRRHTA